LSITVASQHFREQKLSVEAWTQVVRLSEEIEWLDDARQVLLTFLTSQMQQLAPNCVALVGANICARIIAAAGGL
jgi:RNA processing factor Prp31